MRKLRNCFENLNFRRKLFISYLLTIIIPIAVLGAYSYYQAKDFLLQQAVNGLNDSVKQVAVNINYRIERYNSLINLIAYNKRIQQIITNNYKYYSILYIDLIEQVDPLFNNVLNQNEDVLALTIYTGNSVPEDGNFIMSLDRIENEAWYKTLDTGGKTRWFKTGDGIFGARKIRNDYTENYDLLYIRIDEDLLFANFKMIENADYAAFISNGEGDAVFEIDRLSGEFGDAPWEEPGMKGPGAAAVGKSMIQVAGEIPEAGWTLHYYVPVKAIALNFRAFMSVSAIVILICTALLLAMSWMFSNAFVKRIHELNQKIDLVRRGDMQVEITSPYTDEIGQLTSKFGEMLANINRLIAEAYQSKLTQKEAELKALQAQINPHFLYNTLSIINWKAIEIDADEISRLTVNVSNFYRSVLNRGKNLLTIRDELENMKIYIDIKLIMNNYCFDVVYDIDEEVLGYKTINIILQPIVENAIVHGIEKNEGVRGLLKISCRAEEDVIRFCIEDNGVGMEEETAEAVLTKNTTGYGLKNVNDRLKIFFGQQYGIEIASRYGKGTGITVAIPKYSGGEKL